MLKLDYRSGALERVKDTVSQIGLSQDERWANLSDAFEANVNQVAEENVVLLDDVMTTGATLSYAAEALIMAGAKEVYAVTGARAVLD